MKSQSNGCQLSDKWTRYFQASLDHLAHPHCDTAVTSRRAKIPYPQVAHSTTFQARCCHYNMCRSERFYLEASCVG
jgi:hypothetical protein